MNIPKLTKLSGNKSKKRVRDAEDPEASPSKRLEMDTTPPAYGQDSAPSTESTPLNLSPSGSGTPNDESPTATATVAPDAAEEVSASAPEPGAPGQVNASTNETIYHQIGRPDLTGPNPIPPPAIAAAPAPEPKQTFEGFSPPAKYELVPRPEDGFPDIKGHTSKTIRAHLDPVTLKLWEKQEGPGVIAFSPSDNGTIDAAKIVLFRDMLRDSIHAPNLFLIVPDITRATYTEHRPVTPYYIGGINRIQRDLLLHWNCWATPKTAFFIVPKGRFVSNYVMTLENTFLDADDAAIAKVTSALMSTVMADKNHAFEDFVDEHHDAAHPHCTTEDILDLIVGGLEVAPFQVTEKGAAITLFNIYAASPTLDADAYDGWVSLFRSRTYEFYGTANARYPYTCGTCYGQDHPTGMCPYHDLPGWHKTPAKVSKYDKPVNMNGNSPSDRQRGSTGHGKGSRGGRGGGRGGQSRGKGRARGGRY